MKNFLVYSKKSIHNSLTVQEAVDIRLLPQGLRFFYFFSITGFIYAILKKFRFLAFLFVLKIMLFSILTSYKFSNSILTIIIASEIFINVFLVTFGLETEEFFLKRKGYTLQKTITAKNFGEANKMLNDILNINYIPITPTYTKFFNLFKKLKVAK